MDSAVLLGDCFKLFAELPDQSIDLVLSDPPYGLTQNEWDVGIPLDQFWQHVHRVTKPDAAVILFGQDRFTARVVISNERNYRYGLIWEKDKPSGFLNAKRMPMRYHEDIMVFYRRLPTYNPQMWTGEAGHSRGRRFSSKATTTSYGRHDQQDNTAGATEKYPRSILKFNKPSPALHPTEKPIELLKWLIRTYSDPGEVVLDPFAGSGSTAVAATECGRKIIAMEVDSDYHGLAEKRLRAAMTERAVWEKAFVMPD